MTLAQRIYLDAICAIGYEDQAPEYVAARWYHLLWLAVPILGIILFLEGVKASHYRD